MSSLERAAVNVSTLIVAVSGLLYAFMKYLMTNDDPFAVVNHPLQPWMLDLHVLGAPAMIFAVGWIARDHILPKTARRNGNGRAGRRTGWFALVCLLPLVSTGYLLEVFTNETARQVCLVVHLSTGIAYLLVFAGHLVVARAVAARRGNGRRAPTGPPAPPEARAGLSRTLGRAAGDRS